MAAVWVLNVWCQDMQHLSFLVHQACDGLGLKCVVSQPLLQVLDKCFDLLPGQVHSCCE